MAESDSTCAVEYRTLDDFPGYRMGGDGSIWSCLISVGSQWHNDRRMIPGDKWKRLKPDLRKEDGRQRYTLRHRDGRLIRRYGSHFVLLAFVGPCPNGMECCHGPRGCTDDAIDNLRWDTRLENCQDKIREGTQPAGEKHFWCKLTDLQVADILERRKCGEKLHSIAMAYGISDQRVHQIHKKGCR